MQMEKTVYLGLQQQQQQQHLFIYLPNIVKTLW